MTGTFWDKRYAEEGLAYGDAPNEFLRRELDQLDPGSLLLPAEGEGRNAVWAAVNGWKVHAYDTSTIGRDKALGMARRRGVEIKYELRSVLDDADDIEGGFDAAGLVFLHLPARERRDAHRAVAQCLRPGGVLILEAFSSRQLEQGNGGPRDPELLYDVDDLRVDFSAMNILDLDEHTVELHEGRYHSGAACVIRLIATA